MRLTLALAGCILLAGADDKKADKKDGDPLTGTWKVVSLVADGQERDQAKGTFFIYQDGKVTRKGPRGEQKSTYKLDASKKPATIDMTAQGGQRDGMTSKGIFELKGDELKLCIAFMPDAERPKAFASEAGSGNILVVLKKDTTGGAEKADKGNKKAD
jgi:uncharacterized protein (TIGR03067 family)